VAKSAGTGGMFLLRMYGSKAFRLQDQAQSVSSIIMPELMLAQLMLGADPLTLGYFLGPQDIRERYRTTSRTFCSKILPNVACVQQPPAQSLSSPGRL
jgi:hypothetical protein